MSAVPPSESQSAAAVVGLALFLAGRTCMQLLVSARQRRKVGTVSQLILYPVKSCLGVNVTQARVTESGLMCQGVLDRSFAVVSTATGKLVCLKTCPQLSRVQPVLDATCQAGIRLSCPSESSREDVAVSVGQLPSDIISFNMYGLTAYGRACDVETVGWLQAVCCRDDLLLVHCSEPFRPTIDELREAQRLGIASAAFVGEMPSSADSKIAYANTAPLLVATEVALDAVNRRLAEKGKPGVDWRAFRPNLVVSGPLEDRQEEAWTFLFVGGCAIAVLSPCTRCGIVTVDYSTGTALREDGEPLKTLAEYRKDGAFRKFSPVFGVNGFVEQPGDVSVGCEVRA